MTRLSVEFPDINGLPQDEEWCTVQVGGKTETFRFHDYGAIYGVPGLYEELFYNKLQCNSPRTLCGLLEAALGQSDVAPGSLRALDFGAGNGMVGAELRKLGVASVVGVDILPEAAQATARDRPGVYQDYVVADLTRLDDSSRARLTATRPNLLTTVAALGFGDIPSLAFATTWNLLETPGWVVFNIKEDFLDARYQHGFSLLIRRLIEQGLFEVRSKTSYQHRVALDGRPLTYAALVGRKTGPIPDALLARLD